MCHLHNGAVKNLSTYIIFYYYYTYSYVRGTHNQVQLPRGTLLIGYVQTVHAWLAQDGKDVQTNNSTILRR